MRRLTCSCCGGYAGRHKQWHNRDIGFGICTSCIAWLKSRGVSDIEIKHNYGVVGINYGEDK